MQKGISKALADILFLVTTVVASSILYITRLGFVSDDWAFLSIFKSSANQSLAGLIAAYAQPDLIARPMQIVYFSVLYKLFGLTPWGYHLINTLVLVGISVFGYLILKHLKLSRLLSVAIPVTYLLLPIYSTDRLWFAAFIASASVFYYLVSLCLGLKALANNSHSGLLTILSWVFILLSGLSYEVVLPMFFVNIALFFVIHKKKALTLNLGTLFIVIAVFIFKAMVSTRLSTSIFSSLWAYIKYLAYLATGSLYLNGGFYGLFWPRTIYHVIRAKFDISLLIISTIIAVAVFCYLLFIQKKNQFELPAKSFFLKLIMSGITIFGIGYSIFLIANNVEFTPFGIGNRVNIVAAIGYTISVIGILGWGSLLISAKRISSVVFCTLLSIFVFGNVYTVNVVANHWVKASEEEQLVLKDINRNVHLDKANTFILDGVCPYIGPGIVFESSWDLLGALKTQINNSLLHADVVTPRMSVEKEGLRTHIYGMEAVYPFEKLIIYNFQTKQQYLISSQSQAKEYFEKNNSDFDNDCPVGKAGSGANIF